MQANLRKLTRCHICGFTEVLTDEVYDGDLVFLAECPRCDHRWTSSSPPAVEPARIRPMLAARRGIASAA